MPVYIPSTSEKKVTETKIKNKKVKKNDSIFSGKREVINGYVVEQGFTTKNSGFSRWGFANKNGKEYFIKEFLSPVFPSSSEISESIKNKQKEICKQWYDDRQRLFKAITSVSNGNIVVVKQFFKFGNKFYQVTEKIEEGISLDIISSLPIENKIILLKVLAHCLIGLNNVSVVHADLKLNNIIVKKTASGTYTAKIIDISDSYFESEPPKSSEDIKGDFVYLAPETFLRMIGKDAKLTTKIDVFALGIIFHQYMCGKTPEISSDYQYIYESVLNDEPPILDNSIPYDIRSIIERMLVKDPDQRISINEVFEDLTKVKINSHSPAPRFVPIKKSPEKEIKDKPISSGLKINMGMHK